MDTAEIETQIIGRKFVAEDALLGSR